MKPIIRFPGLLLCAATACMGISSGASFADPGNVVFYGGICSNDRGYCSGFFGEDGRAAFTNEHGDTATGWIRGDRVYAEKWNLGGSVSYSGDDVFEIVWDNQSIWLR